MDTDKDFSFLDDLAEIETDYADSPKTSTVRAPGRPGTVRATGATSPLVHDRRDAWHYRLKSPLLRLALIILTVGALVTAGYLYGWPAAKAWWQETTEPEIVEVTPSVTAEPSNSPLDEPPVIHGIDPVTVTAGDKFDPEEGVYVTDAPDGEITDTLSWNGDLDVNTAGDYLLEYSATDSSGKTTYAWRKITVEPKPTEEPEQEATQSPTTQAPATQAPTQTKAPSTTTTQAPTQTKAPTTQAPQTQSRVSQSITVTCQGPATVTFTATGGSGLTYSPQGAVSVSAGGSVTGTASAIGSVNIAYSWSGQGPCSG